jgi:alanine racemase
MPETRLRIDLGAIAANYATLRAAVGAAEVAGVVKADAYGLGARAVAPVLWRAGCRTFFTSKLDEATALRAVLPDAVIYVLEGVVAAEVAAFRAAELRPVLNHPGDLAVWADAGRGCGQRLPAAVHLDTGMCRLGMTGADLERLDPAALAAIEPTLVMSHLACADTPAHPQNRAQLDRFLSLAARLPPAPRSLANSPGCFLGAAYAFDLVRPGAALYGVNPTPARPNPMRPVVRIEAPVLRLVQLDAPTGVGYGATFTAEEGARIATIGVGYADGLPRSAGNAAKALIHDRTVPIVGRVSMDLTTLDVTDLPADAVGVGTLVSLYAEPAGLDATAAACGTIGYECLTRLGQRFRRVYEAPAEPAAGR